MSEQSSAVLESGRAFGFDRATADIGDRQSPGTSPWQVRILRAPTEIGRAMVRGLRRGRHYLRARRELGGLDDHDLRDLGIARADVSRVAWDEACRRIDAAGAASAEDARIVDERVRRFHVWLLIGSGVVAAAQVGKAIISIPLIRSEMAVGLDLAGLIVATFATLGAFFGIGAGVVVRRLGVRRALIGGMATVALGNVIGALAPDASVLLAARIVEGIGFFGAVLAIPTMLAEVVTRTQRDFVMAVWSAYMPAGIMLMLFVGPLLPAIGWRNFWLANAAAATLCSVLLALKAPVLRVAVREPTGRFFAEVGNVVRNPRCVVLAFAFFAYSCQIFSLAFALPLLLTSAHGIALGTAGLLSALVLAVSTVGHVSSGFLLRAGVPIWLNIAMAFGFFALSAFVIYAGALPAQIIALAAALALGIGGFAPGAIYAAAPRAAPSPQAVPLTIGLMQQASNLGQFAGPVVLGLWVEHLGWTAAPAVVAPAAVLGLAAAFASRRVLQTSEPTTATLTVPLPRGLQPVRGTIRR
jgi:MFS transporter, DHA1 family, inner membrane transport protein